MNSVTRVVATGLVAIVVIGGAFYGGMLYQNHADQAALGQYNPPTPAAGGAASRFGGASGFGGGAGAFGGGQNASLRAALQVSTPPTALPNSSTQVPQGSGSASDAGGSGPQTLTVPPGNGASSQAGSSSPAGTGGRGSGRFGLVGQLVSIGGGTVTIQGFQGNESVATTGATRYYLASSANANRLAVGDHVAVAASVTDPSTAQSITVAPSSSLYVSVRSFGGGQGSFGGGAGGGFGGNGGGGGFGGGAAGGGSGTPRARVAPATGVVTSVSASAITVRTGSGAKTFKLSSSTGVYSVAAVPSNRLQAGSFVSVGTGTSGGKQIATAVIGAGAQGAMATLVR